MNTKVKKKKEYIYSYPQNKQYKELLIKGDVLRIAKVIGCSTNYINQILSGNRKMRKDILDIIIRYGEINKLKSEI